MVSTFAIFESDLLDMRSVSMTRFPSVGKVSPSCTASPNSADCQIMNNDTPTPAEGVCTSDIKEAVSPVENDARQNRSVLEKPGPLETQLIASTRSPNSWLSKRQPKAKYSPARPAFVYCGPGTRRIPGVSAFAMTRVEANAGLPKFTAERSAAPTLPYTRGRLATRRRMFSSVLNRNQLHYPDKNESQTDKAYTDNNPLCVNQGLDPPAVSIQAVGDEHRQSNTILPRNHGCQDEWNCTAPRSIRLPEIGSYVPIWRGPEFVPTRKSCWFLASKVNLFNPGSEDVILSGLVIQPATYFHVKSAKEPILLESEKLYGFVQVHNHAYEKSVTIRASHDKWLTYVDLPAKYVMSNGIGEDTSKSKADIFAFRFHLPESSNEFEFAIHYRWWKPGECGSCWDNNCGQNYLLRRKKETVLPPKRSKSSDQEFADSECENSLTT